jgi:hypothetical protein
MKKVYSVRHILLKMGGRRFNKKAFRNYQKVVLKQLEAKYGVLTKKNKLESKSESIERIIETFIFLKYKRKFRRIKGVIRSLRHFLLYY